jgi:hypothetical protein
MPNWCANHAIFSHEDESQVNRLVEAFNKSEFFQTFRPMPDELKDTVSPGEVNPALVAKYGASNWYDWCIQNWGCKWDTQTEDGSAERDGLSVTMNFDTAWSPPIIFYDFMAEQGWTIEAYYFEPGMSFCGTWDTETGDEYYEIGSDDIPEILTDMFGIEDFYDEDND